VEVRVAKIWLFGRLLQLPSRRGDEPGVITDRTAFCAAMLELLMARSVHRLVKWRMLSSSSCSHHATQSHSGDAQASRGQKSALDSKQHCWVKLHVSSVGLKPPPKYPHSRPHRPPNEAKKRAFLGLELPLSQPVAMLGLLAARLVYLTPFKQIMKVPQFDSGLHESAL
jgi:hypothetical protein